MTKSNRESFWQFVWQCKWQVLVLMVLVLSIGRAVFVMTDSSYWAIVAESGVGVAWLSCQVAYYRGRRNGYCKGLGDGAEIATGCITGRIVSAKTVSVTAHEENFDTVG